MIRVLHVEDKADESELICLRLTRLDKELEIERAESASQALRMLEEQHFDCVLSDFQMPEMDGLEFLEVLRGRGDAIPFIFLTGQGNEETASDALRAGADDYYTKITGFAHYERLLNSIRRVVAARREQQERLRVEAAMRESEHKYRSLTQNVNVGIFRNTTGPKGRFVEANPAILRMFGYDSKEEFLKMSVADLYQHPEERSQYNGKIQRSGSVSFEELKLRRKDGSPLIASVSAVAVRDDEGNVQYYDGIIEDITEKKCAEEELKASERRYRFLFENSPAITLMLGPDGEILDLNRTVETSLGYSREHVIGSNALDFVLPELREEVTDRLRRTLKGERLPEYEMQVMAKDGTAHTILFSPGGVNIYESGELVGLLLTGIDITQRKLAEEKIQEREEQNKALLNAIPDMIFRLSSEGIFLDHHASVDSALLEAPEKFLGRGVAEVLPPEIAEKTLASIEEALRTGEVVTFEYELEMDDGQRYFESRMVMCGEDEVLAIVRDISERYRVDEEIRLSRDKLARKATELVAVNEELESYAYTVSHDLGAPLRRIGEYASLLREEIGEGLSDEGNRFLSSIDTAAVELRDLVKVLLRLSRTASGGISPEKVDLSSMAKEICRQHAQDEPDREVEFSIEEKVTAEGDRRLLRIVLENLLSNAWKFTCREEKALIEFGRTEIKGAQVFFVRDNGIGFDKEKAARIFKPFSQIHREGEFPGEGIGLATVTRIIHRHGGRVWTESSPGEGATFYFTLG